MPDPRIHPTARAIRDPLPLRPFPLPSGGPHVPTAEDSAAGLIDAVAAFRLALRSAGAGPPEHLVRQVRKEAEDLVRLITERGGD